MSQSQIVHVWKINMYRFMFEKLRCIDLWCTMYVLINFKKSYLHKLSFNVSNEKICQTSVKVNL